MDDHFEYPVDIYDEQGNIVGIKKRGEVDKRSDIVKTVHLLAFDTFGNALLSVIPRTGDRIWKGMWATTCAGVQRHGESLEFAMQRTMQRELNLCEEIEFVGEEFHDFGNGVKRFVAVFRCRTNQKVIPNPLETPNVQSFEPEEVEELINNKRCAPTLETAWKMCKKL